MPKYTVSCDLLVPVVLEIEAPDEDRALLMLHERPRAELLQLANTENDSIGITNVDISRGGG